MMLAACAALINMIVILHVPGIPLELMCVLLFTQGVFCNALVLGYALGHDIRPPGSAGAALGLVNMCCAGGTAIFLPIIGWLSEVKSPAKAAEGVAALGVSDFRFALSFLIVCIAVAVIAVLLVPETRCKSLYNPD